MDPKARSAYLDGENAMMDGGVTSFAALRDALARRGTGYLTYHDFDLLHLDGRDLTKLPLIERKEALAALLCQLPAKGPIR